jgi:hypothetical protein
MTRDTLDRLVNPLLVKEMYQSLHSHRFVAALWILLGCCLAAFAVVTASHAVDYDNPVARQCGDDLYAGFAVFLFLASAGVLPLLAFFNLREEITSGTFELVRITSIDARRYVRGRIYASLVKALVVFAVVGPFAASAFLYKRIGVVTILVALAAKFLYCVLACSVAVFLASLTSISGLRIVAVVAALAVVGGGVAAGFAAGEAIEDLDSSPVRAREVVVAATMAVLVLVAVWFFAAASANILTFPADKTSNQTKLATLAMVGVVWLACCIGTVIARASSAVSAAIFVGLGVVFLSLMSLLWLVGPTRLAVRHRKRLSRASTLRRLAFFPFADGPGSSAVFLAAGVVAVAIGGGVLASFAADTSDSARAGEVFAILIQFPIYALYLSALARLVASRLPKRLQSTRTAGVCLLAIIAFNLLVPVTWFVATAGRIRPAANLLTAPFPILYMMGWSYRGPEDILLYHLAIPAVIGIGYFGVAFIRQIDAYLQELDWTLFQGRKTTRRKHPGEVITPGAERSNDH